ncbi:tripartite tricarboxylate transporter substrate binding protein [Nonomuraea sp. NPDC052129]|uniref:tripartite tricarboxylate transporter substrate binding protein n=1 Tax=Nonomuraea sp. NPDC052129 TaxID=3154651 RepID=UPI0034355D49
MRLKFAVMAVAVTTALAACGAQQAGGAAGAWPRKGKPITLIVSFAPGAAVDAAARVVAPMLEKELGANVEVLNRPGAGGQIGYTALSKAKADGYTIGATGSPSIVVSPLDPSRGATYTRQSFQPLGMQALDPMLVGAAFLGKHVGAYVGNVSDVKPLVAQGKIKVLGVMSGQRSPFLPDVPTFAEQGYQIEQATARGYAAPAGVPAEVRTKIEAALKKAIEDPAVVAKMKDLGLGTVYKSGQEYATYWTEQETTIKQTLPLVRNEKG